MPVQRTEILDAQTGGRTKVSVAAGETSAAVMVGGDAIVTAAPGGGGTMLAQASWSTPADVVAGTATWFDWDSGAVATKSMQMLLKATAVRFVATTQPGVGEVAT